jgi:parvulin-like peptidyl-prolyl isomerase
VEQLTLWRSKQDKDYLIMRQSFTAILSIVLILSLGCSKSPQNTEDPRFSDKRIVLQEGDNKLTMGEVQKHFSAAKFESAEQEFDLKKDFVSKFLDRFLLMEGAKEAGIAADLDSSIIKRSLLQNLYNEKIMKKIKVTDSDIDDFFAHYGGEIEVGMISVYDSLLADSLYRVLGKGSDFEQLARSFSKHTLSAEKNGNLGYVAYGRLSDKVQDAAFNLKTGEFSKPIRTRSDWEIIKIYDRIKNTKEDLDKNKDKYRETTNQYLQKKRVNDFVDQSRSDIHYKIIEPTVKMMIAKADSAKASGTKAAGLPTSAYLVPAAFSQDEQQMFLVQFDGGGTTVKDYLDLMRGYAPERSPELKNGVILDEILEGLTMPAVLNKIAQREGIDKSEAFIGGIEYLKGNFLAQKMTDKIYSTLDTITENDIVNYYNEHRDQYYMPEQVRVSAIATKTREEAESLLRRIKGGAPLSQLAVKYSLDRESAPKGGDLGFFTVARYTPIFQASTNMKPGDLGGPVEIDGNWWIFTLTERIVKSPKSLELARPDVTSAVAQKTRADAYNNWLTKMREKTHYAMDLDLIKNNLIMGPLTQTGKDSK